MQAKDMKVATGVTRPTTRQETTMPKPRMMTRDEIEAWCWDLAGTTADADSPTGAASAGPTRDQINAACERLLERGDLELVGTQWGGSTLARYRRTRAGIIRRAVALWKEDDDVHHLGGDAYWWRGERVTLDESSGTVHTWLGTVGLVDD